MDDRNLASARMKAQVRRKKMDAKKPENLDEFKKEFVKQIMQDPVQMEYAMKVMPERMSKLMKRYGLKGEQNGTSV